MMEREGDGPAVAELLRAKIAESPDVPAFVAVGSHQQVGEAIDLLHRYGISQLPVVRGDGGEARDLGEIVGSIHDRDLLGRVYLDQDAVRLAVSSVMGPPLGVVRCTASVTEVYGDLHDHAAVVVADGSRPLGVLTQADLLEYLAHRGGV